VGQGRSAVWLCAVAGLTAGGLAPVLWGGSALGLASLLCGLIGGVAGVFLGARLSGI
jgi:hypothetical protein